ncbi:ROK family transcriptional regulator [Glaciibacter superstes]|uniref:ROK family transcriptional regulator n=1 Tax=Glaciibacter superstes TaxID=501023 RepID=UPI0003B5A976|nr:ROK family transcriptional regulator [Glaciibacter superstes]
MVTKVLPGTPAWLGATNDRAALSLLLEHGALTRNQLAELSGLSKPTASQMIARLEAIGVIEPAGAHSGGRGPNAVSYGVCRGRTWGVAIDVQPEVVRSTLIDAVGDSGPVVEEHRGRGDHAPSAADELRLAVKRASKAAGADAQAVRVAAVGIQGAVDPESGELVFTDDLPGWPRQHIREELESALGLELLIHNDVNLGAVAERATGAGRDASSFVLFWVGNGLGLAVDIGGTLHPGATGGAGEIGYLEAPRRAAAIDPAAETFEDLISGEAIAQVARRHGIQAQTFDNTILAIQASPDGDAVLAELAPRIALGVAPVLAVLDPEILILGGPIGNAGGTFLADLVRTHVAENTRWNPTIVTAGVSDFPVLSGASHLLTDRLRELLFAEVSTGR